MDERRSGSPHVAMAVDSAAAMDLDGQRRRGEQRWPISWTILLVLTLSAGLWFAILLGTRTAIRFLTQI